jgi:hypothetical protein
LGIIIPTDFHIFQRGGSTTNQITTFPPFSPTEKAMSRLGNEARPLAGASHRWLRRCGGGDEVGEAGNWHINIMCIYIYITYILHHILYIYIHMFIFLYTYIYIYIYYNMHRITNTHIYIILI